MTSPTNTIEYPVLFNTNGLHQLNAFLENTTYSKLIVLVDNKTKIFCLPILKEAIKYSFFFIEIKNGERNKNLKTSKILWEELTNIGADRNSILINLGGGVITDIGGFVAATYKRGIRFINIPTTVLGMVDAAIGGKTGIDLNGLKNQIGIIKNPLALWVNTTFLDTLDAREIKSGLAEIIKYGFISEASILKTIEEMEMDSFPLDSVLIKKCIDSKLTIVQEDPEEKNRRKILNFGHTLGHAIETYFLSKVKKEQLLHGEAVAIGMILALHLSHQIYDLPIKKVDFYTRLILKFYAKKFKSTMGSNNYLVSKLPNITNEDLAYILPLLQHDKKNNNGQVNFILLKEIGIPVLDCQIDNYQIDIAINYYNTINTLTL